MTCHQHIVKEVTSSTYSVHSYFSLNFHGKSFENHVFSIDYKLFMYGGLYTGGCGYVTKGMDFVNHVFSCHTSSGTPYSLKQQVICGPNYYTLTPGLTVYNGAPALEIYFYRTPSLLLMDRVFQIVTISTSGAS